MIEIMSYFVAALVASFLTMSQCHKHYSAFVAAFDKPYTHFTLNEEDGSKRHFVIREVESFEKYKEELAEDSRVLNSALATLRNGETNGADRDDRRSHSRVRHADDGQLDNCRAS